MTNDDELPFVHVERPLLPWREAPALTECGLPKENHPVITRHDFIRKVREQGQKRAQLTTCITCFETAQRHPTWEEDPVAALGREVGYGGRKRAPLLLAELRAIAELVERHYAEYLEIREQQSTIVRIEDAARAHGPRRGAS